jgi:hypothetical protein
LSSSTRWLVIVASVVVVVVLFVLLQPGDPDKGRTSPSPSSPSPSSPSPSSSGSPSPSASPQPERTIVEVTFRDGSVQGPTEFTLSQGERVRILVHADVTDEVHLHGYDLHADVTPSRPARIDFVADVAGVFECELEGAGTLLFRLEITP